MDFSPALIIAEPLGIIMTTLPATNNLWILLLISGFVMAFYGFSMQFEYGDFQDEDRLLTKKLRYELENTGKYIEKVIRNNALTDTLNKNPELYRDDIDRIKEESLALMNKYDTEQNEIKKKLDLADLEYKIKSENYDREQYEHLFIILFGCILFAIGFRNIMLGQVYRDKILYAEYLSLDVKQPNCQSCGMDLIYDDDFDQKSNFCTYCFKEGKFNHPNISLSEFKEIIKVQLEAKGYSKLKRKVHLKDVENLMRWRQKFDWKE